MPDTGAQMTSVLKVYVGFVIPLQSNLTKTETKYSLTCLVWWISLEKMWI